MAQAGYTPIQLYYSTTAAAVPLAANLAQGELAINIADGKLYYENSSGVVTLLAGAGGAGIVAGSNTQIQFNNGGLFGASANLTWDGTTLSSTQINITGQGTLRLQDTTGGEYVGLRAPASLGASYTLTFPADDGTSGQALITDGSGVLSWSTAASGDVYGPASSTDNAVARFDSTTGKIIQNSVVIVGDTGDVSGVGTLSAATLTLTNALGTAYGGTGLTSFTSGGVVYASSTSALATGSALTFDGTNLFTTGSLLLGGVSSTGSLGEIGLANSKAIRFRNGANNAYLNAMYVDASNDLHLGAGTSDAIIEVFGLGEAMRIKSTSGNVGIGTSSPASKLDVRAASAAMGNYQTIQAFSTDTSAAIDLGGGISLGGFYNSTQIAQFGSIAGRKENGTSSNYAGYLSFGTNSQATGVREVMRLDSAGNLGLGVTPSAFTSTIKALQIGPTSVFRAGDSAYTQATFVASNARQASAVDYYIANGYASQYGQQAGAHYWYTAASGTAGNAISFTQAMTLDASGNLGIGTSSPFAKLSVTTTNGNFGISNGNTSGGTKIQAFGTSTTSDGYLAFEGYTVEYGRFNTSGNFVARNIGVGSTTPTTSGTGITFPATQSASSDANTLDDYEEGTFTATLKGGTSDPTTPITTTGYYTKIGNLVQVNINFTNINNTGASGVVSATGLPFTASASSIDIGSVMSLQFDFNGGTSICCYIGGSTTTLYFQTSANNATWASVFHNAGTGRYLWASATYRV